MKIIHRITFTKNALIESKLTKLGVSFRKTPLPGQSYLIHIDVTESDPLWFEIANLANSINALDVYNTTFSHEEIAEADWVRVCPEFEKGYPEPYANLGWLHSTLSDVCVDCGVGYTQVSPYRIKKEPNLGENQFVSLISTQTIFCTSSVVKILRDENIKGLHYLPPTIISKNEPSVNIFQWQVDRVSKPGIKDESLAIKCNRCGTIKYPPHLKDYMLLDKSAFHKEVDVFLSHEWFGSGHAAYREFFVSHRLAGIFLQKKWRGIRLKPIKLV